MSLEVEDLLPSTHLHSNSLEMCLNAIKNLHVWFLQVCFVTFCHYTLQFFCLFRLFACCCLFDFLCFLTSSFTFPLVVHLCLAFLLCVLSICICILSSEVSSENLPQRECYGIKNVISITYSVHTGNIVHVLIKT